MNVGLFFGSFNPIHIGHLIIASLVREQAGLDQVWFVVSPQNPFKERTGLLHEFDRLDLVRAAIEDDPRFQASDIEFSMPKPSYTSHTLVYLAEKFPSYRFGLILGGDSLENLPRWKNAEAIVSGHPIYVYQRPGHPLEPALMKEWTAQADIRPVDAMEMSISATVIRQMIAEGKSIRYLVPPSVETLIASRGYYKG